MNATATEPVTFRSRSGAISITKQFRTVNGRWDVTATKQNGEKFASKFFLVEDEAKAYANELWRTDGVEASTTPAPPHQDWFDATGQSRVARSDLATDRQMEYLRSLIAERDFLSLPSEVKGQVAQVRDNTSFRPSKRNASAMIDALKTTAFASSVSSDGFSRDRQQAAGNSYLETAKKGDVHVVDGTYYRIYVGQASGKPYACQAIITGEAEWAEDGSLVQAAHVEWEIARGMITKLSASTMASAEQAAAFGKLVGRCCFCSHAIDTPESTSVGYGPVCAEKFGLPWGVN